MMLAQVVLALGAILWLALRRPASAWDLGLWAMAGAALLLAVRLAGIWTYLPLWTPLALGGLLAFAAAWSAWRLRGQRQSSPPSWWRWAERATALALLGLGTALSGLALAGRTPPSDPILDFAFPLRDGAFYVANGGSTALVNAHAGWADDPRLWRYRGQRHAVDLVQVNRLGFRTAAGAFGPLQPAEPEAYLIFGRPVVAPCNGQVEAAMDGLPDMRVPDTDRGNPTGNHVILRCGGFMVLLAHLRNGSVRVKPGGAITMGEEIGAVGNSGNTGEPHLHVHAQRPGPADAPLSGDGVPIRFGRRFLVRNDVVTVGRPFGDQED
ncbi:M23 family metallopeptidase [Microvirga sp. BSC39]|uniref:M23 family metallopeptidase n=1 Tax=Microvirga sp. BSC39 TaxID=1549810 RepID=UPI000690E2E2|nr:M23 family metallopeptidase [Microvirga sp. BSC39]